MGGTSEEFNDGTGPVGPPVAPADTESVGSAAGHASDGAVQHTSALMHSMMAVNAAEPRLSRRGRLLVAVGAVGVAAIVVAAIVVLSDNGAKTATTSTLSATTTTVPDPAAVSPLGSTFESDSGIRVVVPPGAISGPGRIEVTPAELPNDVGEALESISPIADIHLSGATLLAPITVIFPITDATLFDQVPGPEGTPIDPAVVFGHWTGSEWEPIEAKLDRFTMTASAQMPSLSIGGFFRVVGNFISDTVKSAAEAITGSILTFVPEPVCAGDDDSQNWVADPANNPVSWCAAAGADGSTVLQVANRRRYAVTVSAPQGHVTALSTDLSAQLSALTFNDGTVVLAPGEAADITFDPGTSAPHVSVAYDGLAQVVTTMLVSAEILATVAGRMPFGKTKAVTEFKAMLERSDCVKAVTLNLPAAASSFASSMVKILHGCFKKELLGAALSSVVGTLFSVIAFAFSSGQSLFDMIFGGAQGTLTRSATGNPDDLAAFSGSWTGTLQQPGFADYTLNLTMSADGTGSEDFPDLQCSGMLSLVRVNGNLLTTLETITVDAGHRCVKSGQVILQLNEDGSLLWSFTGEVTSSGTLHRAAAPDPGVLAQFTGTWSGPVHQPGAQAYSLELTINPDGSGTQTYPELTCSGTMTFIGLTGNVLKGLETITVNPSRCVVTGVMTMALNPDGTLAWHYSTSAGIADAILTRQGAPAGLWTQETFSAAAGGLTWETGKAMITCSGFRAAPQAVATSGTNGKEIYIFSTAADAIAYADWRADLMRAANDSTMSCMAGRAAIEYAGPASAEATTDGYTLKRNSGLAGFALTPDSSWVIECANVLVEGYFAIVPLEDCPAGP